MRMLVATFKAHEPNSTGTVWQPVVETWLSGIYSRLFLIQSLRCKNGHSLATCPAGALSMDAFLAPCSTFRSTRADWHGAQCPRGQRHLQRRDLIRNKQL